MERSILQWSIRALLLALGTGMVVSGLRLRPASVLHRAWTAAMLGMLLLPAWTQWAPSVNAPVLPAARERAAIETAPPEIPVSRVAPRAPVAEPIRPVPRPPSPDWQQVLLAVYLAGVTVMLARLIRGTLQVRSMMRGAGRAEGFVTSARCAAPVTVGWLHPVLFLPDCWRTWPPGKLEAVLTHEREHVRRRDPLVQWLALLNRCVFWFHPVAWWLERKLAALAEEACDAAVLAGGHAAPDYARYLIEIARSVNQAGARLRWAGAVAFSAGKLPQRIRRIMDASPVAPVSRAKAIASVVLCTLTIATFLACNLSRPSRPAPGQANMSEQDQGHRAALLQRQQQQLESDSSAWIKARNLTADGAKELEAHVEADPGDPNKLLELMRYYQYKKDLTSLDALTLWFIGQHPDLRLGWGYRPLWDQVWDQGGYDRASQLWTAQLKKQWQSPYVYMNAAEYLSGNDNGQAEQALLEGQRRFPSSALHWQVFLARHYAWALIGSPGQLPGGRRVVLPAESVAPPAQGAYPGKVRQTLLASTDTELLTRTVEQLQRNTQNLEFTRSLIDRTLSIDPNNRTAHMQRDGLRQFALELRAKTDPASVTDADRMVLLLAQLRRWNIKDGDTVANELLKLASRHPKDPSYGSAIFLANMTLGEAALNRGDRPQAVRRLLAAADAPPTDLLRYDQIDMSFARRLVDAGERDSVATFLDRCAKFNKAGKPLAEWAGQIRKGLNPDLTPSSNVFRQSNFLIKAPRTPVRAAGVDRTIIRRW